MITLGLGGGIGACCVYAICGVPEGRTLTPQPQYRTKLILETKTLTLRVFLGIYSLQHLVD